MPILAQQKTMKIAGWVGGVGSAANSCDDKFNANATSSIRRGNFMMF